MRLVSLTQANELEVISEAVAVLKRGGSMVYPTDTVYGLGVNPLDDFAARRLFRIKKRPTHKPVPLVVKNLAMAKKLAYIDSKKEKILNKIWPGAVSIVLYKKKVVSYIISSGSETVSLRIPDNKFCKNLLEAFDGPITSTSANISDEQHTNNIDEVVARFRGELYKPDLVIDGGVLEVRQPSTVIDLTKERPKVIRVGPVKPRDLTDILNT